MAIEFETAIMTQLGLVLGNPVFIVAFFVTFVLIILIFGRVGMMASVPIFLMTMILASRAVPELLVPYGILLGILVGISIYRLYKG